MLTYIEIIVKLHLSGFCYANLMCF